MPKEIHVSCKDQFTPFKVLRNSSITKMVWMKPQRLCIVETCVVKD